MSETFKSHNYSPEVRGSYDRVAAEYARRFRDELDKKPFDRWILRWFAEKVGRVGPICDLGCGPGHVARYLRGLGSEVRGVDLSEAMVEQARQLNPDISFERGDMLDLTNVADDEFAGIAAFYSIVNIPRSSLTSTMGELRRALRPGGTLLLSFHVGQETRHLDEWLGAEVNLDFYFYETAEVTENLRSANLIVEEVIERGPYGEDVEVQTRRGYIFARKP